MKRRIRDARRAEVVFVSRSFRKRQDDRDERARGSELLLRGQPAAPSWFEQVPRALCANVTPKIQRIAVAIDAREERFLTSLPAVLQQLKTQRGEGRGALPGVARMPCSQSATRRRGVSIRWRWRVRVEEGIERERRSCSSSSPGWRISCSTPATLNVHQLKAAIVAQIEAGSGPGLGRQPDFLRISLRYARYGRAALRRALPAEPALRIAQGLRPSHRP